MRKYTSAQLRRLTWIVESARHVTAVNSSLVQARDSGARFMFRERFALGAPAGRLRELTQEPLPPETGRVPPISLRGIALKIAF
jgi:hypothetical protein